MFQSQTLFSILVFDPLFLFVLSQLVYREDQVVFGISKHESTFFKTKELRQVYFDLLLQFRNTSLITKYTSNFDRVKYLSFHLLCLLNGNHLIKFDSYSRGQDIHNKPIYHSKTSVFQFFILFDFICQKFIF